MKKTLAVLGLTLALLIVMDGLVALALNVFERQGRLNTLVRYFDYGRSVPGKLRNWEDHPEDRDNLYDFAWRSQSFDASVARFAEEPADTGPVVRSYGMSFVVNILGAAVNQDPSVAWDNHSGPAAPPNFTFTLFTDDRVNRRPGDIVVLGILSSSVAAMAAMSNRTWAFEQPAPFTYPVYWPEGDSGLKRVEPLINSAAAERALRTDPDAARAWRDQLAHEDAFYSYAAFGATWLDRSPFARLVRRSLALGQISRTDAKILSGRAYPHDEVLRRMIQAFAAMAREDEQIPIVLLIQSREPDDPDLLAITRPALEAGAIPYLATAEHFDPRNIGGFLGDGHYKPEVDMMFGARFLDILEAQAPAVRRHP